MVVERTRYEIEEKFKETYGEDYAVTFENAITVNNTFVARYDEDDEFYTDGEHYVPVNAVKDCIEWKDALVYIIENGEYNDFMESQFNVVVERAVKHCYSVTVTEQELQDMYIDYVSENADLFYEWLWEQKNDKN